jgi:hypothetical protein
VAYRRVALRLPVIPPPPQGTATVLIAGDGFMGPFLKGDGPIDLLCGNCLHRLVEQSHPGQIENLVLQCPNCKSHNAIVSIPALENFVAHLQAVPAAFDQLPKLKAILEDANHRKSAHTDVFALIEQQLPDLAQVKDLLVPKTPGDFYGLLTFVVGFLAWLQSRKPAKQSPSVVINNYFNELDPFRNAKPNDRCPCGSGKKFKKCHGK